MISSGRGKNHRKVSASFVLVGDERVLERFARDFVFEDEIPIRSHGAVLEGDASTLGTLFFDLNIVGGARDLFDGNPGVERNGHRNVVAALFIGRKILHLGSLPRSPGRAGGNGPDAVDAPRGIIAGAHHRGKGEDIGAVPIGEGC